MYNQKVIDIFKNPPNVGRVVKADGVGTVGNAVCGDIMEVSIKVENNVIVDAKFQTFGCTSAIAATAVATTLIKGKTLEQAAMVKNSDVVEKLGGLPIHKIHCSVLAEEAIAAAITDYHAKLEKKAKKEAK